MKKICLIVLVFCLSLALFALPALAGSAEETDFEELKAGRTKGLTSINPNGTYLYHSENNLKI